MKIAPVGNHDDRSWVAPLNPEPLEELVPVGAVKVQVKEAEEEVAMGKDGKRFVHRAGHDRLVSPALEEAGQMSAGDRLGFHYEREPLLHRSSRKRDAPAFAVW